MFDKILIANRGEIACRVAATARRLGIRTVAVYSDADARSRHVAACDEAYRLGPAPARESYLRGDAILEIALRTGAQAIHPGYGFLSENEQFAQAASERGVVFIGPPAKAIAAMGSKSAAKSLMEKAQVPLVPGYHGDDQDPAYLKGQADAIGYPVLIKASAGGGGKGMRIVAKHAEFDAMLASCKREAKNAFGDDTVLIERYVQRPRHVEIQVFADTHGNFVHLFERDCSVQRRHQKVIEEAPAPGMTAERRRAMGDAAVAAARAVGYVGAGTVEFIVEPDGRFYFMEMNTRLQVEHPVTEMITGQDLVEWQLRVAAGQRLPLLQDELAIHGHSLEARVYAENPDKGFLPSTGQLRYLATPAAAHFTVGAAGGEPAGVRIDSGIREGDAITPFYDPMIAKLITWGRDRAEATARMDQALAEFDVVGPATNVAFLKRLMRSPAFSGADLDTGLIERERELLLPPAATPTPTVLAIAAAAVLSIEDEAAARAAPAGSADPWALRTGWRPCGWQSRPMGFRRGDAQFPVTLSYAGRGYSVQVGDEIVCLSDLAWNPATRRLGGLVGGEAFEARAVLEGETLHLFGPSGPQQLGYAPPLAHAGDDAAEGGNLTAPMPGKVVALLCAQGDRVSRGQPLLVMEAMKMEHTIAAPADGEVTGLPFAVGDQVDEGAQLIGFAPA
ncbi:acetyl-CoA carboxylase biotin carboxylase subunit [Quisquiliibacterium transsilvanicum]|uniref:3-methylcrotonyl-CoA carboxylase alpha subunit n=1 Tax=Quisquiliibacterium transsilvanicum TaxID=1549638 RepID=A0A7W8HL24_9BURK|nr:acetyl/propionyl/methylcrotonyl-CoA carboxylase subunit alpha [Quisquiliibacterium transsilvanicum]MBB5273381.1 3-methylcrotonyl-CoA carboxylase alpha subunit [Quisquiliibacterium transsilvanicum]